VDALDRWREAQPDTFWDDGSPFAAHLDPAGLERVRAFGVTVAQEVDPEVYASELNGPQIHAGTRIEFDPAYHRVGSAVWASGVLNAGAWEQAAMLYLLTHAGESGQACPVVCTAGLIRALRREASDELRERFLPPLLEPDYAICHRGAQFLTEIQGGSDVGANTTEAVPHGDAWRLHGEKWFCSVADADQFVITARPRGAPEGTRGIGCFLVPRLVDGAPNGFTIERLKDKLGTRALATGEFTFDGALAYPIGSPDDGFRIAAGVVLNTSRWLNALGSAGLMRRAFLVAESFSRTREAFGRPIAEFPLVRENLAVMKAEAQAALVSSLEVTALVEKLDNGTASADDEAWFRILVNANKVVTSLAATAVARRGIEALGGNGTIEDFSPLPRLYRDAIVFESWEGTHNVLVAQVLRDLARMDALELVRERVGEIDGLHRAVEEPGDVDGRRVVEALVRTAQVTALLDAGDEESAHTVAGRHLP
jgi:alkylation response protein AidB-like acyl-CoA dehydrogenase